MIEETLYRERRRDYSEAMRESAAMKLKDQ